MANAKKLPSGSWRVQVRKVVDGVSVRKSFTSESKKEAELMAAQWQNMSGMTESPEKMTLNEAFRRYIESKRNVLSPSTIKEYVRISRNNLACIMQTDVYSLTNENVQVAINIEAADRSPKTVRNIHGLLSAVLAMFRPDFALKTRLPQRNKPDIYIPEDDDIAKLMSAVAGTNMEVPVLLAAFGPMRRGEICALTSDDINGNTVTVNKSMVLNENREWVIKAPKTYAGYREIELPQFIIDKIKDIDGRITQYTPNSITEIFGRVLKNNGIPHFRFHSLRHFSVSILHAMGVPDAYIMRRGGWISEYTMKTVYRHILENENKQFDAQIANKFDEFYNEKRNISC